MTERKTDRQDKDRQKDKPHSLNSKVMTNTSKCVEQTVSLVTDAQVPLKVKAFARHYYVHGFVISSDWDYLCGAGVYTRFFPSAITLQLYLFVTADASMLLVQMHPKSFQPKISPSFHLSFTIYHLFISSTSCSNLLLKKFNASAIFVQMHLSTFFFSLLDYLTLFIIQRRISL